MSKMTRPELKRIFADFKTGPNYHGLLALDTQDSLDSIRATGARVGEKVVLMTNDGGGVWVEALLVKQDGIMLAKFDWNDIEDVRESHE